MIALKRPKASLNFFLIGLSSLTPFVANADSSSIAISAAQIKQAGITTQLLQQIAGGSSAQDISIQGQAIWSPNSKYTISSPVSGVIQSITAQPLTQVNKSAVLVTIYSPDIINWQNELLQLRAQQSAASQALAREKKLFSEGIIAEKRVIEAQSTLQQININIQAKQRLLKFSGAASNSNLNPITTVRSPNSGILNQWSISPGQHVETGQALGELVNANAPLMLTLQANSADARYIHQGDVVTVDKCPIQGRVVQTSPSLNNNAQTQQILVQLSGTAACLHANQYVTARINTSSKPSTAASWQVPTTAITFKNNKNYVFIRQSSGFSAVPVNITNSGKAVSQITSPSLNASQQIAVTGIDRLKAVWIGFGADQAPRSAAPATK